MSYNTHKRDALDAACPLAHRVSHARSLAVMIASRHGVDRDIVLAEVRRRIGVDLHAVASPEDLVRAVVCLDELRESPEWTK